jgi:NADPH:quinone reductase-like Zn-dependent oxidoreductase
MDYVKSLGADEVFDYREPKTPSALRDTGPFAYVLSATGDPTAATAVAAVMQPQGGRFVHLRPCTESMDLPTNVELLYNSFSLTTSRDDDSAFTRWWYDE